MAHNLEGNMAPNKIVAICIYKNISRKHRLANTKIQIIIMAKIFSKNSHSKNDSQSRGHHCKKLIPLP